MNPDEPVTYVSRARLLIADILGRSNGRRAVRVSISGVLAELLEALYRWLKRTAPQIYRDSIEEIDPGYEYAEIDEETLNLIGEALAEDFAKLVGEMERDANRTIRNLAEQRIARERVTQPGSSNSGALAERELVAEMREAGLSFTDRSGRRWDPEVYARMAIQTGMARLRNSARLNAAAKMESRGVIVSDNEGPNSCEACKVANGQRWSLAVAAEELIEHPHCVRDFTPMPTIDTTPLDRGNSITNVRAA